MAPLRQLMVAGTKGLSPRRTGLAARHFRRTHRFCGECGAPMTRGKGWAQGVSSRPCRLSAHLPCIIVAVRKGPAILLAAHRRHYQADDPMYTVLASFVEAGRIWSSAWRGRCSRRAASG